ncbi:MAG: threonine ammonia-lyase IlvA [Actinomycetales bacterium]
MNTPPVDADAVEEAARALSGLVSQTPLQSNARLSELHGTSVWLKREDLQPVRSYKLRGALQLMSNLPRLDRTRGVVCASAGNHAQGVAFACHQMAVKGRIYLPRNTPRQKRDRITAIGGSMVETVVFGDTYDEAAEMAASDARHTGASIVPAFDHPATVAGNGTVAVEIVDQMLELTGYEPDVIVIPVGGGGLLAGCATWLRERHPDVQIAGVEPAGAASMLAALEAGQTVSLESVDTFVDGAAVRRAGEVPFNLIQAARVEIGTVDEGRVCTEMLDLYQMDGIIAEPAGALASASLGDTVLISPGQRVVCVLSGGNNDVSRYAEVVERALIYSGRKFYFLVEFPQEPGALRRFLDQVLGPDDDITLFEYVKRNNRETGPALVGIEIAAPDDLEPLLRRMAQARLRIEPVPADSPLFRFLV